MRPADTILPRSFYERSVIQVARDLLGARLVRVEAGRRMAGMILETEAYAGEEDLACHARAGRTPRTQIMYGPGGFAYVYFNYGVHWMLNIVAEPCDHPAAILIRAIQPLEGLEIMAAHRPQPPRKTTHKEAHPHPDLTGWTDGPGKLTQALAIDGSFNGLDLTDPMGPLCVEQGQAIPDREVITGPRVGINRVPEPWKSKPWRFLSHFMV